MTWCEMIGLGLAFAVLMILLTIDADFLVHLDGPVAGRMIMFSPVLSMAAHGLVPSTIHVPMRGPRRYPAGVSENLAGHFAVDVAGTGVASDVSDG